MEFFIVPLFSFFGVLYNLRIPVMGPDTWSALIITCTMTVTVVNGEQSSW